MYARNHTILAGEAASLRPSDAHPSAVEYLLAALGADLSSGLRREARRARVEVDALELSLTARLDNPLVHLGVVGEEGRPGLAEVRGRAYVRTDGEPEVVAALWAKVLARSVTYDTLARAAPLAIELRVTP